MSIVAEEAIQNMKRWIWAAGLLLSLPVMANAQVDTRPFSEFTTAQKCIIANELVFIMRAGAGGLSPEQRIDRVNEQLAYILGYEPLNPSRTRAIRRGDHYEIFIGNSKLVSVYPVDARANGTTLARLANNWVTNLRRTLPQARPLSRA
jgi:hypothetical protein